MRKQTRDLARLAEGLGFTFLGTARGRGEHTKLLLKTPGGRDIKQPIPHDMGTQRHWLNFRSQLKKRLLP